MSSCNILTEPLSFFTDGMYDESYFSCLIYYFIFCLLLFIVCVVGRRVFLFIMRILKIEDNIS